MDEAYGTWVSSGAQVTRPLYLAWRAEGLALADDCAGALALLRDARQLAEHHGERYHEAEIRRLSGEVALRWAESLGHTERIAALRQARVDLDAAWTIASAQGKVAFMLRAALAWVGLDRQTGLQRVRQALAEVAGGETTADVRAAHALLGVRADAPAGSANAAGEHRSLKDSA
jgi:predicted ATPase